jgi:hypothetical protein
MGNDQPALCALFTCESGLSEPEIGLELGARFHHFLLLIWQMTTNGRIRTVPGLQKQLQTALILSVTFI